MEIDFWVFSRRAATGVMILDPIVKVGVSALRMVDVMDGS